MGKSQCEHRPEAGRRLQPRPTAMVADQRPFSLAPSRRTLRRLGLRNLDVPDVAAAPTEGDWAVEGIPRRQEGKA